MKDDPDALPDVIQWFRTLPLWLDLGDLKVVHACWDKEAIESISNELNGGSHLDENMLVSASRKGTWQYEAVETDPQGQGNTSRERRQFPRQGRQRAASHPRALVGPRCDYLQGGLHGAGERQDAHPGR